MILRTTYINQMYNNKNSEGSNTIQRTLNQMNKRAQSIELKPTFQEKRLSVVMKNARPSFAPVIQKPQPKRSKLEGKLNPYGAIKERDTRGQMPVLIEYNASQLTGKGSNINKNDTMNSISSTESFMTKFANQNEFPKVRQQVTLHKGASHHNITNSYNAKNKIYQPARSSTFALNNSSATYAVNTTNGLIRNYNEDRVSIVVNIKKKSGWTHWPNCSYFAVFDGHGGSVCADFLKDHLHKFILENPKFPSEPIKAVKEGCERAEAEFCALALKQTNVDRSGSCGLILLFVEDILYIANIGDCRAIISENNGKTIQALTKDHKPEEPSEQERIIKNGGQVSKSSLWQHHRLAEHLKERMIELPYRVYPGGLSVSRSFGDITAKNTEFGGNPNVLIAAPDIRTYRVDPNKTDFIIVGCKLKRRWRI